MKRTIIAAAALILTALSITWFTETASADTASIQDQIIVELNNERVYNAFVNICDVTNGYTDNNGIFYPGNVDGKHQVVANWSGYGKSIQYTFTTGQDIVLLSLQSGSVGCDNQ